MDAPGLIAMPDGVRLDQAVAVLADGWTALALVRAAALEAGQTVLVEAAAGGVGSLLVQLAAGTAARVVAAAGGQRKLEVARRRDAPVPAAGGAPRSAGHWAVQS